MIATNAQAIVNARAKGFKPDELILVSLMGRINEENHTVYADPDKDYDWSWARGLQICIYSSAGLDWRRAALATVKAKPELLLLWDTGRSEGAELHYLPTVETIHLPKAQWKWKFDYIPWVDSQNREFVCN